MHNSCKSPSLVAVCGRRGLHSVGRAVLLCEFLLSFCVHFSSFWGPCGASRTSGWPCKINLYLQTWRYNIRLMEVFGSVVLPVELARGSHPLPPPPPAPPTPPPCGTFWRVVPFLTSPFLSSSFFYASSTSFPSAQVSSSPSFRNSSAPPHPLWRGCSALISSYHHHDGSSICVAWRHPSCRSLPIVPLLQVPPTSDQTSTPKAPGVLSKQRFHRMSLRLADQVAQLNGLSCSSHGGRPSLDITTFPVAIRS